MEQPCYKCGQAVEQGIPFCPHCAAPQIRVVLPEPASPVAVALPSQGAIVLPSPEPTPYIALPMRWSATVQPCAMAALIAAVAMVLKLMVPILAVLGAGFLAVAFYRRNSPGIAVGAGAGARLGALCGLFCFGITAILEALAAVVLHKGEEIRRFLLDAIQQTAARYPDPQFQPGLDFMRSPAGLVFMMVFLLMFGFLTFLLLGTCGGALGGALLGRRDRA